MRAIDADALKRKVVEWMPCDLCGIEEREFSFEADIVVSLMMEIEEAPTIEPEPHWIPVSDRLPEKDGYYLVSEDDGGVEVEWYDNTGWGYCGVIARRPLPPVYHKETNGENY